MNHRYNVDKTRPRRGHKYTKYRMCLSMMMVVQYATPKQHLKFRISRPEVFCEKGVLRNFAKFTGKHLCQSLFFNKVAGLRPATLLKKRLWHRCFPVNFVKFLGTPFFTEHLRWLLLEVEFMKKLSNTEAELKKNH